MNTPSGNELKLYNIKPTPDSNAMCYNRENDSFH